jgi:hypothetical protein
VSDGAGHWSLNMVGGRWGCIGMWLRCPNWRCKLIRFEALVCWDTSTVSELLVGGVAMESA